jgi:hypothetical protein
MFSLCFFLITSSDNMCETPEVNSTSCASQTKPFDGFFSSFYEAFLLGIAVAAPRDWYFSESPNSEAMIMVYIFSLVFNSLILLNLMIAIMNQRMTELVPYKATLVTVAQLAIYVFAEDRMHFGKKTCGFPTRLRQKRLVEKDGRFLLCTSEPIRVLTKK